MVEGIEKTTATFDGIRGIETILIMLNGTRKTTDSDPGNTNC